MARTLRLCAIFASLAAAAAVLATFIPSGGASFFLILVCLALTLVFGGAIIPSATGVLQAVVSSEARQLSSAGSMFLFQLFGYALSPLVSSLVMSMFGGDVPAEEEGEEVAIEVAINSSCVAGGDSVGSDQNLSVSQLRVGFRVVMWWGGLGATFFFLSYRAAARVQRESQSRATATRIVGVQPGLTTTST